MGRGGRRAKKRRPPRRPEPPRTPARPRPPEPPERVRPLWNEFGVLCALLAGLFVARMGLSLAWTHWVYSGEFVYYPGPGNSSVVVTPPFELTGRTSSVEVGVSTDLDNAWVYFDYALIEQRTGRAIEFGREVGYYHGSYDRVGYESPRSARTVPTGWTEGSQDDAVRVPAVPAGRYVLRIAPQGPVTVRYAVRVWRDVPGWEFYAVAFLLLLVPPVLSSLGGARSRRRTRPQWPRR